MIATVIAGMTFMLDLVTAVVKRLLIAGFLLILVILTFIMLFATLLCHLVQ